MQSLGELLERSAPEVCREVKARAVDELLRRVKRRRRENRIERFERTIRDGLEYSRGVGKRLTKPKGSGGALLEFQIRRIPA